MKRIFLSLLAIVIALPVLAAGPKEAKLIKAKGKKIDGQYIVVFEDRLPEDVDALSDELVYKHRGRKDHVYKHTVKGFSAKLSEKEAEALAADPRVAYVEEDGEVTIQATQSGATWGLDRVDQRDLPLNQTYNYNYDGTGVTAYILDTGIKVGHAQFGSRRVSGYDAVTSGGSADDCNGHGTHVAGTVGGSTYGVAKNVTLVPVRVLDCAGSGSDSGVIAGIDWVTSHHAAGARAVANMSLGGGASTSLDDAVRRSIADGVTYAIASGNSNVDACSSSPARVAEAITVNSTTSSDARSSFSNYGSCTDIFAPGSSITSAWHTSTTATNTISGTSMATPHVAGVIALYLQQNGYQSPATVASALYGAATLNKVTSAGSGSPNRLLHSFFGGTTTPVPSISSFSPTSAGVGASVTINGANFSGASAVRFNGQSASFSVISSSQISATVPNCSSTGVISVVTAAGTGSSAGVFTVTGCGGTTPSQLLLNPGFESGANGNWTTTSSVIDSSTGRPARSGAWKAWMCGYGTTRTDYILQTKTIPATATSASLSFWVRIDSAETTTSVAYDLLRVQISTNGGSTYTTLATYSNLNKNSTYVQKSFDLSAYRGSSVTVRLYATEDSSLQTSFVVDDTALNVQ